MSEQASTTEQKVGLECFIENSDIMFVGFNVFVCLRGDGGYFPRLNSGVLNDFFASTGECMRVQLHC